MSPRPLKKRVKDLVEFALPPALENGARLAREVVTYAPDLTELRRNAALRHSHKGEEVFVLANGPSLNNYDVTKLAGRQAIVMNHFQLAPWKDTVDIVAHCYGEPARSPAWEDPTPVVAGTNARSYWFHISAKRLLAPLPIADDKRRRIHYAMASVEPGLWHGRAMNLSWPALSYQTTAQLAIMVALHLGYARVNLLGFDHDWLCTRGHSPHFYEEREGIAKADLSKFSYYEVIRFSERMWRIYFALKRTADACGAHIVNLSNPTFLDVFDRGR
jgi:hypothetical protein